MQEQRRDCHRRVGPSQATDGFSSEEYKEQGRSHPWLILPVVILNRDVPLPGPSYSYTATHNYLDA